MITLDPVKKEDLTTHPTGTVVVFAENQPQYIPLPVVKFADGSLYSEWTLPQEQAEELAQAILDGRPLKIRLWQWTFNRPLQPVSLELV